MRDNEPLYQLAHLAAIERDADKLVALYEQINELLKQHDAETIKATDTPGKIR
jgi:hypothetical protein